jgi:hypothetical protein
MIYAISFQERTSLGMEQLFTQFPITLKKARKQVQQFSEKALQIKRSEELKNKYSLDFLVAQICLIRIPFFS